MACVSFLAKRLGVRAVLCRFPAVRWHSQFQFHLGVMPLLFRQKRPHALLQQLITLRIEVQLVVAKKLCARFAIRPKRQGVSLDVLQALVFADVILDQLIDLFFFIRLSPAGNAR
jgi:hypothetical protein